MLSITSVQVSRSAKSHVSFSPEVERKERLRTQKAKVDDIITSLNNATKLFISDRREALNIIESTISKISDTFQEGTYEYNKLMAKAIIDKGTLLPRKSRFSLFDQANALDPTDDKFGSKL